MLHRRLRVITGLCSFAVALAVLVAVLPVGATAQSLLTAGRAAVGSAAPGPSRPNIVLITADDMRADDLEFMPRTKRLLGQAGVTFTDALSNYPLCCPARATLLTGQYSHNNGIKGNEWPYGGYRKFYETGDEQETLPVWLQRVGYSTGFIGKYLNGYSSQKPEEATPGGARYVPPGWDDWRATVGRIMQYYCPTLNQNGTLRRFPGEYQTDLYTRLARRFIDQHATDGKPFFLWTSHLAPHLGHSPSADNPCQNGPGLPAPPAKRHWGMFKGIPLPKYDLKKDSFNEPDIDDKGSYMRDRDPLDLTHQELVHESRLESVQALDESVADTVAALRAKGLLGNTMIVFASDNGWLLGEHRAEKKILPYEESLRVPIVVRGPGFPADVHRDQPVGLVDIPATALDVSGAVATKPQDGTSLVGPAQDAADLARRVMPIEAGPAPVMQKRYGVVNPDWYYRGARAARYSYVAWQMADSEEEEFYDLAQDPFQLTSTAHTPSDALDAMRQMTSSLESCKGNVLNAPSSCVQTLPDGVDDEVTSSRDTTGDPGSPHITDVRAPKGWVRTTRPTIHYTVADETDPAGSLSHWCSDQASDCDGTATLRLPGEGHHKWVVHVTDPAGNVGSAFGQVLVDLYRPRVKATSAAQKVSEEAPAAVSWRVSDSASGVRSTDTRRRTAGLRGSFTPWRYPASLQDRPRPPRSTSLPSGHGTVCLQVRALDVAGRQSAWRAQLCRARAIDASAVTRGRDWRTVKLKGWYAGTGTVTRRRGDSLLVRSSGGVGLVRLVAQTGPRMGSLKVTVGDTVVRRISLDASSKRRKVFVLATPRRSGAVRATVTSSNRPVWVDSIGVVRRP